MEGWKKIALENACLIQKGIQFNKIELENYGAYPCINGGLQPSGYSEKWNTEADTITISEGGESCGFVNRISSRFWCGGHCYALLQIKGQISKDFLYFALKGRENNIMDLRVGSGLPNIQQKALKKFCFAFPASDTEQRKIATILNSIDRSIAQTEQLMAKNKSIKQGLMHDLLTYGIDQNGTIRNPQTHIFADKNGMIVPEEWEVDAVGNLNYVTKLAGYEFTKYFDYSIGGEIIALRALNIKNEHIVLDNIQTIPKKTSDLLPRSKINKGDVLITYIGAYIGEVLLINENDKYHLAPNIAKIIAGSKILPEFLEIVLRTHIVQKQIKNLTAVTATPSLTMRQVRNILIQFPKEKSEQKRIVNAIHTINENMLNEKNNLAKLQKIKHGLMQDLLTGKVRVKI